MLIDIIVLLIIIYGAFQGFKRGFSKTVFSILGWIGAMFGAYLITPFIKDYCINDLNLTLSFDNYTMIPAVMRDTVSQTTTNLVLTILVYMVVFVVIKILIWLIASLFTRNNRTSFIGMIDGFFGMLFGILKGTIIACILVAVALPICGLLEPDFTSNIENLLSTSRIAILLYDNNPIYYLLKGLFLN